MLCFPPVFYFYGFGFMQAIETLNLSYDYPDGSVGLRNITAGFRKGKCTAIVGPNGSGKTTLLLHFTGILRPKKGEVKVFGETLSEGNTKEIRSTIGTVFQNPDDQLFSPTVYDDVAFGPLNQGVNGEPLEKRVSNALKSVGMEGYGERSSHHLSFGEKKRVSIATVLSMKPKILVLDEPTMGMDPWIKKDFLTLLSILKNTYTLVISTHDKTIVDMCDEFIALEKGELADKSIWSEI